jgi:hypothetical protein
MTHPVGYATKLLKESGDTYRLTEAQVYCVKEDGVFQLLNARPDVYEALEDTVIPDDAIAIAVVTTGWAAPLNADGQAEGMPSQHPERRRVKLVACADSEFAGSALVFEDTPEDVITDEGSASGSLADALAEAWSNR